MAKISLEDQIRRVQQKYKNVPSPLANLNPETQMQLGVDLGKDSVPKKPQNIRQNLLGDFKPIKDHF